MIYRSLMFCTRSPDGKWKTNCMINIFISGAYIWSDNFKENSLILLKFEKKNE